ncbi:MAG: hypothetical protein JO033_20020, partial [Acidobacteriaceae bacterium]|nr:hypothetical protein [Acidobacteriaceae bacterium]
ADLAITPEIRDDHAAYVGHWLNVLKNDKRAIFSAAAHAQKATDYLKSLQPARSSPPLKSLRGAARAAPFVFRWHSAQRGQLCQSFKSIDCTCRNAVRTALRNNGLTELRACLSFVCLIKREAWEKLPSRSISLARSRLLVIPSFMWAPTRRPPRWTGRQFAAKPPRFSISLPCRVTLCTRNYRP